MRLLIPHEHGAYGQLAFPMLAALAVGHPAPAAGLLVVGCLAAFIATEPVLVLLGQRGPRAAREQAADARTTLVWTAGVALVAGVAAVLMMPTSHRWTVAVPAVLALVAIPLIAFRVQKSVAGELHIATMLSTCAVPVGVAAGVSPLDAALVAAVFAMGFCGATLGVRASISAQRREPASLLRAGAVCVAGVAPVLLWVAPSWLLIAPTAWTTALPLSLVAVILAAGLPSARRIRTVGWGITSAALAAVVLLAIVLGG